MNVCNLCISFILKHDYRDMLGRSRAYFNTLIMFYHMKGINNLIQHHSLPSSSFLPSFYPSTNLSLTYGMRNVALFDIFIFLLDLTSLLLYVFGFVFNVWPFLFYMFRFYSIFYDLYSISVYFYCIIFVCIVYSVICIVYFWICI